MDCELSAVASDLKETPVSAGRGVCKPNYLHDYAESVVEPPDEPQQTRLGRLGCAHVGQETTWCHQEHAYLRAYRSPTGGIKILKRTAGA
jgi:hypothetical protein